MLAAAVTAWISFEGLNGVGKTYLVQALAARLGPGCVVVDDLADTGGHTAATRIHTLATGGGTFLGAGRLAVETLPFAALDVREYEHITGPNAPRWVLADRGIDTIAVYQAAVLGGGPALADRIAAITHAVLPPPDRTVLLLDDFRACVDRFATHLGHPVGAADRELLATVADLYSHRAAAEPARWLPCRRTGRATDVVLDELEIWCRGTADRCEVIPDAA